MSQHQSEATGTREAMADHEVASIPVAIVGMSCRFSGDATSPSKLWQLCAEGKGGWSPIPPERFDVKSTYHPDKERIGRSHVVGGYFMKDDLALFDAAFFNFTGEAASAMDPQVRLMLEMVYEATEDAGIPIENLVGSNTSVFSGCFSKDYQDILMKDPDNLPSSFLTGNGTAMLSNRISHFYDLRGASASVDTGCSAGLVALYQGCRSVQTGESDISIVGGAGLLLSPDLFIAMSSQGVIGSDGRCYAWDTRAGGYGRGEGIATLVVKPLTSALRDGDRIHAVIRQIALNQDGKTTTISSPSMEAQEALIKDSYRRAGLDIAETGYVEAHMTGTQAGDLTEAEALARTFGQARRQGDPVIVGSVKTNLGHTEAVSGLAAVIKTAFILKHGQIPRNLNYENVNTKLKLGEWKLQVPTVLTEFPKDKVRRASINNFGYGGTNAHLILDAAPDAPVHRDGTTNGDVSKLKSRIFLLSGKDSVTAQSMSRNLAAYLQQKLSADEEPGLDDLAYTLAERRSRLPWLVAVTAESTSQLADKLDEGKLKASHTVKTPRIGFVFNGQGAQWHAMGRELISSYPVFAAAIRKAERILKDFGANWSLLEELMRDKVSTRVHATNISQPISVAIQLCLVDLLKSWGVIASAVTSHSSGEIAAAYTVGALTFDQALGVVYYRGELALKHQQLASLQGGMLAAGLSAAGAEKYLVDSENGRVIVACINSPDSVTLSGDLRAIDEVAAKLEADGIFARKLQVPLAYHSHHMLHMAEEYTEALRSVLDNISDWTGAVFASPTTGQILTSPSELGPEHWVRNLTNPVLFSQAFEAMCFGTDTRANVDFILEIGAHSTLSGPIRQILGDRKLNYASTLKRSADAVQTMQEVACELLLRGYPVKVGAVNFPTDSIHTPKFLDDLPTYAWNHSTRYWLEPRVQTEHATRRFPQHEFLGSSTPGTNSLNPTWRNILRLSDVSWLADHQLDTKVVVPGAGYISMALEAIRLVTDPSERSIQGYRVRNVDFLTALTVPESSSGVETQFVLRPKSEKELDYKGWYDFDVYSVTGTTWIHHCKGSVSVLMETAGVQTPENTLAKALPQATEFLGRDKKVKDITASSIFEGLRGMNIHHGPSFQNLLGSRKSDNKAVTDIKISELVGVEGDSAYVLHPTTLDSIIQATYAGLPEETGKDSMVIPRSVDEMFVPKGLHRTSGARLQVLTELLKSSGSGATSAISVLNHDVAHQPSAEYLSISKLHCQAVPIEVDSTSQAPSLCFKSRWELDILHQVPTALKDEMKIQLTSQELDFEKKLRQASYIFIHDAVAQLNNRDSQVQLPHHQRLLKWMKSTVALGQSGKLFPGSQKLAKTSRGLKQMLFDDLEAANAAGQLTCRLGKHLSSILLGQSDPNVLMEADNLLNQYYQSAPGLTNRTYKHLSKIVQLYAAKVPGAKVLEIGAGTGGATAVVLEAFAARGEGSGSLLGQYDFTDLSPGCFETAKQRLTRWGELISYKQLDINCDPSGQAFVQGTYDLVVASDVLHQAKDIHQALAHARSLLKPDGTLLLIETTQVRLDSQLIFGTLPGSWHGAGSEGEPTQYLSLATWDHALRESGFTGTEFSIDDCESTDVQSTSLLLARADGSQTPSYPSSMLMIYPEPGPSRSWLDAVAHAIGTGIGICVEVQSLNDAILDDRACIFIDDVETPFLQSMDAKGFDRLRKLLVSSAGLLWISRSGAVDAEKPLFSQTLGLLRTMRQEDSTKKYVHLDLDANPATHTGQADEISCIVHALKQSFDENISHSAIEWEMAVKDSTLYVPRIYPSKVQNAAISKTSLASQPKSEPFQQENRSLVWETDKTGLLSNLHFTENLDVARAVPVGMVEIEPRALGLNFRDVMLALGQLDATLLVGECSGIITRLGPGTEKSGLAVGDRVCGLYKGRFASTVRSFWTGVTKIPKAMSWEEAASIPIIYITVWHCLFDIARLQKDERVLIHAGTGGVGQAAIMLAQWAGAEVFVTCSTAAKREFLTSQYHIDPDRIFSSRDDSFASEIMARTNGAGVDVVINSLAGPLLKATWDCVGRFGRFLEIGKVDMEAARGLDMTPFTRGATISGVDVLQLNEYKGPVVLNALTNVLQLCQEGSIRPVYPITTYSISDMELAMRSMQAGTHIGKIVLVPRPGDEVQVISRPQPVELQDSDATYLIAGGLGGIGRAIAEWMVERGAKNIVLVSRNAESHPDADRLTQQARSEGCNLMVRNCDVADEQSLTRLLADCVAQMPPIRGVVTAAMHLNDTVMERMTFDQWQAGVRPKVAGTANLHNHLVDLDFFVMLSSITGVIGHVSQANYAAGNAFQDTLARHRAGLGLPAVALDLGAVMSVGVVAESGEEMRERLEKSLGAVSLELDSVLKLVESAIRDRVRPTPDDSQVITCIPPYELAGEDTAVRRDRRFATLCLESSARSSMEAGTSGEVGAIATLSQVLSKGFPSLGEAVRFVTDAVISKLADMFNIISSDMDASLPLSQYGVDSLVAVELRNWLSSAAKAKVSIFEIVQSSSLADFGSLVASKSEYLRASALAKV